MNNYDSPGNYYVTSSSTAQSFANTPFTNAFTLKVEYANGTAYPCQTFTEFSSGKKAWRLKGSSGWNDYVYFSDDATFLSYHNPTKVTDFNELRSIGAYWINPSDTPKNHPSNTFGILEVMGGMQRFTEYDNQRRIFVRFYANSQWTSWVSFDHS